MPDKQLTIATYAAGASLAAITLVYVFAPTFFIDGDASGSAGSRKSGAVGLLNSANDCFINSVLQALAGLGDLRIYLIRETHRRRLDGKEVYTTIAEDPQRKLPAWKIEGLQRGIVTQGLKDMLDALNERPLHRKTITASAFVRSLEDAFRQRISRQQQDAQEFLQVVAERLCDEYHAGHRARRARDAKLLGHKAIDEEKLDQQLSQLAIESGGDESTVKAPVLSERTPISTEDSPTGSSPKSQESDDVSYDEEDGFPLEGKSESQIECLTCGFKPKPIRSTFCTLTLNVPQVGSTTLNTCFDGMFKTEYIDDFKCEKCRLVQAVETFQYEMKKSNSEKFKIATQKAIDKLTEAIETDPEEPPKDVELPDSKFAPKRKIARYTRITNFPKIMAIHLSRSIFDASRSSLKNSAKVAFPERLPLGSLLDQKKYKLLGVVTHKGSHHSGHYESFRRQNIYPPFSTPNAFNKSGVYSRSGTPAVSTAATPQVNAVHRPEDSLTSPSTPELLSPVSPASSPTVSRVSLASSLSSSHPRPSTDSLRALPNGRSKSHPAPPPGPTSAPRDSPARHLDAETSSLRSDARSAITTLSKAPNSINNNVSSRASTPKSPSPNSASASASASASPPSLSTPPSRDSDKENRPTGQNPREKEKERDQQSTKTIAQSMSLKQRRKKVSDRWWRISDEKIKESKTSEVLSMQREVYLLFYELEKGGDD